MKIHSPKGTRNYTEQEMIEKFDVDLERWNPKTLKTNVRPTTVKRKDGEIAQVENFQTTLTFERKYPEFFDDVSEYIQQFLESKPLDRTEVLGIEKDGGSWRHIEDLHRQHSDILNTTFYADVHLDKRTKTSTKTKINRIIEADKRIFDRMDRFASNKQLIAVLGDFFNSDNSYRTTKGTEQQNSVNEYEAFRLGIDMLAEILYNRAGYTDVDLMLVPGNHDENKLKYARDVLHYYFQNHPGIHVMPVTDSDRYYYKRGNNVLGMTHGHLVKPKDLPSIMNSEAPNGKYKERYTGHKHKSFKESYHDMEVNTVPAVSERGEWNKKRGVDHRNKQLFGTLHHKKDGKLAEFYQRI